jgi:cytochrome b subunit of formate dehydrogenase
MMLGAVAWAAAALSGLQALFAHFSWLYRVFPGRGRLFLV